MNEENPNAAAVSCGIIRWKAGGVRECSDHVVREEPLEVRVRGRSVAITMRTPGHDQELAAGFLVSEGVIARREDVIEVAHCRQGEAAHLGNVINVFLAPHVQVDLEALTRHVFASSSCGLCGKASIESVHRYFPSIRSGIKVSPEVLRTLPDKLRRAQVAFEQTGGLHAAAIFSDDGGLVVLREDVGRHNAVDKAIGNCFLRGVWPLEKHLLLVSGRASFEIMQKALAARIPFVAAISAPSSLAVEFAQESGQTLVGFLRGETFNVYAHPEGIVPSVPTAE